MPLWTLWIWKSLFSKVLCRERRVGRPSYHPSVLLKIYVYGILNRIASSRRLAKETKRNTEMMWLMGRLMAYLKTIANFRKESTKQPMYGPPIVSRMDMRGPRHADLFWMAY